MRLSLRHHLETLRSACFHVPNAHACLAACTSASSAHVAQLLARVTGGTRMSTWAPQRSWRHTAGWQTLGYVPHRPGIGACGTNAESAIGHLQGSPHGEDAERAQCLPLPYHLQLRAHVPEGPQPRGCHREDEDGARCGVRDTADEGMHSRRCGCVFCLPLRIVCVLMDMTGPACRSLGKISASRILASRCVLFYSILDHSSIMDAANHVSGRARRKDSRKACQSGRD